MGARLIFFGIAAFWVAMNVLLWQREVGLHGGDTPVPLKLVWHKILTAPDASSLNVYRDGERMGFCEISTGVGLQMATVDQDKPTEGFVSREGYQLQVAGNVSLGDFTNRFKFEGRVSFDRAQNWQELTLKMGNRLAAIEIHSLATNRTAHVKFSNDGTPVWQRDVTLTDLQHPGAILRELAGGTAADTWGVFDWGDFLPDAAAQKVEWEAHRTRVKMGSETVPVYQLATSLLGRAITVDISTLGEILRVELPGDIDVRIDEWSK